MPLGIGELKSLRTLSKIIVGGENDFAITELKNFQNLHGEISIWGLGNVKNVTDARKENLSQKHLSELELDWGNEVNFFQTERHDKEVMNELKPRNDTLKRLKIVSYGGLEFPTWVGDPLFHQLMHVKIDGCEECTSLPRLGQLPSLKELFIGKMSKVNVVDREFLGTGLAFPSLEALTFQDMKGWEEWSITCDHGVLTSLVDVASSVTKLELYEISGLTHEIWRGVLKYLGAVEEISMEMCNEIRYLWKSEAEASNAVSLKDKEEDNCWSNLTSLRSLNISYCNSLEHCTCPNNMEDLEMHNYDSITSISFPIGERNIKSLSIEGCKELLENELGGGGEIINSRNHMLKYVYISAWPNLKSITELGFFIYLTTLSIEDCPNMVSFPDHELPNLKALTHLVIKDCPSMDASFPRGLWPPKLRHLWIGGLKKPLSEWGPQTFPTSLIELVLWGRPYDGVSNFDQLSHLLPSSITSLVIDEFEKVESVSTGLQHLTSLQYLVISKCPKMKDLPEKLLLSLLSLRMFECPLLKERSIKGSFYWPLTSLIPFFHTYP